MEKHDRFHFHAARLHGLSCRSEEACEYEVELTVSSKPDSPGSSGVDQGEIEKRADQWLIVQRSKRASSARRNWTRRGSSDAA